MRSALELEELIPNLIDLAGASSWTVNFLFREAALTPPERFMHLVPEDVQRAMREWSDNPPASIADFDSIEGEVYRPEFFQGLTDEDVERKIADGKILSKQQWLDGVRAVHEFFFRQSKMDGSI